MSEGDEGAGRPARPKRADAQRNEKALLDAAAAVFVTPGVEAPVRDIAAKAGVGMDTIYLRGVGSLCASASGDPDYDARRLVGILVEGLRRPG